jgi:hypothetical protein
MPTQKPSVSDALAEVKRNLDNIRQFYLIAAQLRADIEEAKRLLTEQGSDSPNHQVDKCGDLVGWLSFPALTRRQGSDDWVESVEVFGDMQIWTAKFFIPNGISWCFRGKPILTTTLDSNSFYQLGSASLYQISDAEIENEEMEPDAFHMLSLSRDDYPHPPLDGYNGKFYSLDKFRKELYKSLKDFGDYSTFGALWMYLEYEFPSYDLTNLEEAVYDMTLKSSPKNLSVGNGKISLTMSSP